MERGYVKLWRKVVDNPIIQKPDLFTFWCWCLMKATHKPCTHLVGFQPVKLDPGQFVFGLKSASKELKMSIQTIRTCLRVLKNLENLTYYPTYRYSIISIVNWDIYQPENKTPNNQSNTLPTRCQHAANNKQEHKEHKELYTTSNFLEFWKAYPRKVGKGAAYKSWKRIKKFDGFMDLLFSALNTQKESDQWNRNNGQYIPHPTTWLNQRRWEDETETVKREMEYL